MRHEEGRFSGARGITIYEQAWMPDGDPAAVVVIAHGFAEHGGRYAQLAARLVDSGYAVRVADNRGHGRSGGKRTAVVRFSDYVDDLHAEIQRSRDRMGALPLLLVGHSMGGLIALALATTHPDDIDALVVSAPPVLPGDVSAVTLAVGRLLSRVTPDVCVLRLPLHKISRDPAVVAAYTNDPLVFRTPVRARLGAEMLATMQQVDAALPSLRVPLLVMQGADDALVDPRNGPRVHERAGADDKTLKMYDGLWHEIFNEPERERVLDDLVTWLDAHAQSPRAKAAAGAR